MIGRALVADEGVGGIEANGSGFARRGGWPVRPARLSALPLFMPAIRRNTAEPTAVIRVRSDDPSTGSPASMASSRLGRNGQPLRSSPRWAPGSEGFASGLACSEALAIVPITNCLFATVVDPFDSNPVYRTQRFDEVAKRPSGDGVPLRRRFRPLSILQFRIGSAVRVARGPPTDSTRDGSM